MGVSISISEDPFTLETNSRKNLKKQFFGIQSKKKKNFTILISLILTFKVDELCYHIILQVTKEEEIMAELKLVIYENDKIIGTIQKETITDSQNLIKSLEEFRNLVNEKFTMIIEDDGHIDDLIEEDVSSSDGEIETNQHTSPKKRKM